MTAARLADGHSDRQAGRKAKSVTTVPAVALAKAGQLTHIVRVICRVNFKTVKIWRVFVVQYFIKSYRH